MEFVDINAIIPIHYRGLNELPSASELAKETEEALLREERQKRLARRQEEKKQKREKKDGVEGSGPKTKRKKKVKTAEVSEKEKVPERTDADSGFVGGEEQPEEEVKSPSVEAFEKLEVTPTVLVTPVTTTLVAQTKTAGPSSPKKLKNKKTSAASSSRAPPPPVKTSKKNSRIAEEEADTRYGIPGYNKIISEPLDVDWEVPHGIQKYASSMFQRYCLGYVRQELDGLPFEVVMSNFCQYALELGSAASLLWERSLCYESMKRGEMPPEVAKEVAVAKAKEEAAKKAITDERDRLLKEKADLVVDLASKKEEVEDLTAKLAEAARKEKEAAAAKIKMNKDLASLRETIRKNDEKIVALKVDKLRLVRRFLSSKSFQTAARLAVGPSAHNALHSALVRVKRNFPCDPSEFQLPLHTGGPPDLSKCSWDQERDLLLDYECQEMTEPALFPDFEKVELKYKWEGTRPDVVLPDESPEGFSESSSSQGDSESEEESEDEVEEPDAEAKGEDEVEKKTEASQEGEGEEDKKKGEADEETEDKGEQ